MKKGAAFILLLIFSFQTLHAGCVTIWFFANRAYVAEKLCVNKNRPVLKCNGKCFLSKKLKEAERESQQELPRSIKQLEDPAPFFISTYEYAIGFALKYFIYKPSVESTYTFNPKMEIFKPPCITA